MFFSILRCAVAFAALAGCCSAANADIIYINAQVNGASTAGGGPTNPDVLPGAYLPDIYAPKNQLTLTAGTYLVTNAATSGTYSAWNYEGFPSSSNWAWSFLIADDQTSTVLVDGWVDGTASTQAGVAGLTGITTWNGNTLLSATSTAGFTYTLTLAQTTTLDFLIDDYYLPDNGGGVALNISPLAPPSAPEPSTLTLFGIAAATIGIWRRIARPKGGP